ncbi:MAG: RNA-binding protein [Dehalococcoidia bacterium]
MKIYVGNLSYETTDDEVRKEFEAFGVVASVDLMKDKYTGRSRGFGFIDMPSISEGQAAITGLNGKMLNERTLDVNPARERSESKGGGGGGNKGGKPYGDKRGGGFNKGRQGRY